METSTIEYRVARSHKEVSEGKECSKKTEREAETQLHREYYSMCTTVHCRVLQYLLYGVLQSTTVSALRCSTEYYSICTTVYYRVLQSIAGSVKQDTVIWMSATDSYRLSTTVYCSICTTEYCTVLHRSLQV